MSIEHNDEYRAGYKAGYDKGDRNGYERGINESKCELSRSGHEKLNDIDQLKRIADMLEAVIRTQHWA